MCASAADCSSDAVALGRHAVDEAVGGDPVRPLHEHGRAVDLDGEALAVAVARGARPRACAGRCARVRAPRATPSTASARLERVEVLPRRARSATSARGRSMATSSVDVVRARRPASPRPPRSVARSVAPPRVSRARPGARRDRPSRRHAPASRARRSSARWNDLHVVEARRVPGLERAPAARCRWSRSAGPSPSRSGRAPCA